MGLFKKRADPAETELLRAELAAMGARLDAADEAKQQLGTRVQELAGQIDEQRNTPPPAPPPVPAVSERDIDMLRAQLQRLSVRVDETETGSTAGAAGTAELDEVRTRLDMVAHRLEEALADDGDASDHPIDPAELGEVRSRLDLLTHRLEEALAPDDDGSEHTIDATDVHDLRQRLEALDAIVSMSLAGDGGGSVDAAAFEQLQARVDELGARFDTPLTTPPPPSPPAPAAVEPRFAVDDDALSDINDRLDALAARLDDVDVRITSISTELANQITEISGELEGLGAGEPAADQLVDELRDAQTRLANEQARYQIAFRQDLADLAERLKRA